MSKNKVFSVADYVNDYLVQQYYQDSQCSTIVLQHMSINDLLPFYHNLCKFKSLKKLVLHGNQLKQLPTDLSALLNLEEIDLSNNQQLSNNVTLTIASLKTLPSLRILIYPVTDKNKQIEITHKLKKLEYLNNTKIIRQQIKSEFVYRYMNKKTINHFEKYVLNMHRNLQQFQKKQLDQQIIIQDTQKFEKQVNKIGQQSLQKIQSNKDRATQTLEAVMLFIMKFQMLDVLKAKATNVCVSVFSDLGVMIQSIVEQQDKIFRALAQQSLYLIRLEYEIIEKQGRQKQFATQEGQLHIMLKNMRLQKQIKRLRRQNIQMNTRNKQLLIENDKMMQSIMTFVDGNQNQNKLKSSLKNNENIKLIQNIQKTNNIDNKNIQQPLYTINSNYNNNNNNISLINQNKKLLTLKQLKDVIVEIYQGKQKYDQKNYDGKLAPQTMHQYLFTFLNQKYGLKSLTIEAASSIISGIQHNSIKDNDVAVFGKILRNEIDEQFRFVQIDLKKTINSLLKDHIKTKLPFKNQNQINQIIHQKYNSQINWQQCQDIIKFLYNIIDSGILLKKIQKIIQKDQQNNNNISINKKYKKHQIQNNNNKNKIKFNIFLQQVLAFQLKNHQNFLKPLVNIFKRIDLDNDGIINDQDFIKIILSLSNQLNQIIPQLLNIVDPYDTKIITFTQTVKLVANYPIKDPILTRFKAKNTEHLIND